MVGIASKEQVKQNTSPMAGISRTASLFGGGFGGFGGAGAAGLTGGAPGFLKDLGTTGEGSLLADIQKQFDIQKNQSFDFFRNIRDVGRPGSSLSTKDFLSGISSQFRRPKEKK